jgi:hypothetical protein
MLSEQLGEGNQELSFHFDTQFNRIILFGRSALLGVLALWIFTAWKRAPVPSLVALAVAGGAGYWFVKDYPVLSEYRVDVVQNGLRITTPPEGPKEIPWRSIEGMVLTGKEYVDVPSGGGQPFVVVDVGTGEVMSSGKTPEFAWEHLPDIEVMELTLAGGARERVYVKVLSVEQRKVLYRAIAKYAGLVRQDDGAPSMRTQ